MNKGINDLPSDGWRNPYCNSPSFLGHWHYVKAGTKIMDYERSRLVGYPMFGNMAMLGHEEGGGILLKYLVQYGNG
jgi:hypothetical protein